jgi:hypothetical protein
MPAGGGGGFLPVMMARCMSTARASCEQKRREGQRLACGLGARRRAEGELRVRVSLWVRVRDQADWPPSTVQPCVFSARLFLSQDAVEEGGQDKVRVRVSFWVRVRG